MNAGRYGFTCQECRETFDSTEPGDGDWDEAHRQANEAGWRFTIGMGGGFDGGLGANITCPRCVAGDEKAVPLWVPA